MKKKILLPTDFSKNAWNAALYAIEFYKNETCDFYLLNCFITSSGYTLSGEVAPALYEREYKEAEGASRKNLGEILEKLSSVSQNPDHKFFIESYHSTILDAIQDIVKKKDIEMIVMGTKGSTNTKGLFYGSNTIAVMEEERNCPVLAVPKEANFVVPQEIVFPTDYKVYYKRRELRYLVEISKKYNTAVRILHISEEENDRVENEQKNNRNLLKEYFEGLPYSFHVLHHINVGAAIRCFVESRDSDMVVFINKKHGFFKKLLSKATVKELGYHFQVPVLALHDVGN